VIAALLTCLPAWCAALQDWDDPRLFEPEPDIQIAHEVVEGEILCSVQAVRVPAVRLVRSLAKELGQELEGVELLSPTSVVSVDMERRPVRQVWEFMVGSLGLRADVRSHVVSLRTEAADVATSDAMLEEASRRFIGLQRDYPDHPLVAEALFQRGWVEERRGVSAAAWTSYELLVEHFPESERVPQALLRAGLAFSAAGEWERGAARLSELLRREDQAEMEAPARAALARCLAHLGRSETALAMLDALDTSLPAVSGADQQDRQYARARALVGLRRWKEAIAALDLADARPPTSHQEHEALELRALALEGMADWSGASRNWLLLSKRLEGNERTIALRHAARLAFAAGDDLAVLFMADMAKHDSEVGEFGRQAGERLGWERSAPTSESVQQRLDRAERALAGGTELEAHALLTSIHPMRGTLTPDELRRFALMYAPALAQRDGLDGAIELLREAARATPSGEDRRIMYLLAGELLERGDRLEQAIAAYEGRL
jgi:tetratricopeptide (TPR) repeat protein